MGAHLNTLLHERVFREGAEGFHKQTLTDDTLTDELEHSKFIIE